MLSKTGRFPFIFTSSVSRQARFLSILSLVLGCTLFFLFYTHSFSDYIVFNKPSHPTPTHHTEQFVETKFGFQQDLDLLTYPSIDLKIFRNHKPHNFAIDIADGTKQETFATYFCSPNSSVHDPYFAATLNLVYRNLWSPTISSKSRPFTVFVAPFVTQEQRDILAGAGAVIHELDLVPWEPNVAGVWSRWRDQFSKLHFWNQSQYDTIAFMDSDAFPIKNIDSVFDDVHSLQCNESMLDEDEAVVKEEICNYGFAGVFNYGGGVNGGFLVVKPNHAMYQRLMRNYQRVDEYDNSVAEQSFFLWQFAEDGAFPAQMLPRKYNAFFPNEEDNGQVSVVHEKLWAIRDTDAPWLRDIWGTGWREMVEYFDSPKFLTDRERDGRLVIEGED
jgi:inositol 3-alpha-galactosyltransferase